MNPLRLAAFSALLLAGSAPGLRAQVQASLVAADAGVQPGTPVTVALHLVQQPGWHTYWINPGTGLATSLDWRLPPGWKAGPIQWPTPEVLRDEQGNVIGNGYQGDLLLPVTLTPPATLRPGQRVTIRARTDWLMCREVCKPGRAALALGLEVTAGPPPPNPRWGRRIRAVLAELPRDDDAWGLSAVRGDKTITLDVAPRGHPSPPSTESLHFFSQDDLVGYDLPQSVQPDGRGGFLLTLQISPDGPTDATRLVGVLASDGWETGGSLPGLQVDLPFGRPAAPAAAAARAPSGGAGATTPPAPSSGSAGLAATLFLAFVGGVVLNLMPCVFPVLGIKILGFVHQAGGERRKVATHGLLFTLGVLLSFWALAGLLAALRGGGEQLGWGFQLQSPPFVFALTAGLLLFALNLSGVFEFGLSATGLGGDLQSRSGLAGSFFAGVLATVVATPCSAPFLATALGAALTFSPAGSLLIFTAIGLGLSLPYLLLSVFPGAVRVLPRPGPWMETFRQFIAFPLYASVGYLLWVLAGQVQESSLLLLLFGLVLVAMGAWAYGRWRAPGASAARAAFGLAAGLALVGAGVWAGWPEPPRPTGVTWEKWSPAEVARLRRENRVIYVDFTARWCATCQANKRIVFHSDAVLRAFRQEHVAALRGDWTSQDPQITAELAKYKRSAVPFNVIWLPGRTRPIILPSLLTPGIVLQALKA